MLQNCSGSTLYLWSGLYLQRRDSLWDITLLYVFEISILFVSFPLTMFVLYQCYLGGVFHRNLLSLFVFNCVNLFPALLSRLFFVYNELILGIQSGPCCLPVVAALFIKQAYIAGVFHSPLFFCVERLLAVYFIQDYELKRRTYIPAICIPLLYFISFANAALAIMGEQKRVMTGLIYVTVFISFTVTIYILLIIWHKRVYSNQRSSRYSTLSARYQLSENLKVLEFFRYIVLSFAAQVFLITAVVFATFQLGLTATLVEISEILQTAAPLVTFLTIIFSIEKWKRSFLCWRSRDVRKGSVVPVAVDQATTDLYFQQLHATWNK